MFRVTLPPFTQARGACHRSFRLLGGLALLGLLTVAAPRPAAAQIGGSLYSTGGDITITVQPATAGYTSQLHLYSPGPARYIATNNQVGTRVVLTGIPAGQELIFGIYVTNTGNTFRMGPGSRNPDGQPHARVTFQAANRAIVGFEDLYGGGDRDYDDNVFLFEGGVAPDPVPVNTAPTVTRPPAQTVECVQDHHSADVTLNTRVADADGDEVTVRWSVDGTVVKTQTVTAPAGGTDLSLVRSYRLGVHQVEVAVSDAEATTRTTTTVNVVDTTAPVVLGVQNVEVNTDPGECEASNVLLPTPVVSDNCCVASLDNDAPDVFPHGETVVTWTATDESGNSTTVEQKVTVVDREAPVISASLGVTALWPPDHRLQSVGLSASATDNCDDAVSVVVHVYADEDDEEATGDGNHSPDARQSRGELRLRAERKGNADGRVYLIVVEATDASGNTSRVAGTVTVARSNSAADRQRAAAQAAAAQGYFDANGTIPPGFFLVGDGPTIGPKQ